MYIYIYISTLTYLAGLGEVGVTVYFGNDKSTLICAMTPMLYLASHLAIIPGEGN